MTCNNCGKEVELFGTDVECLQWRHADGYYSCDGRRGHSDKYAEPLAERPVSAGEEDKEKKI